MIMSTECQSGGALHRNQHGAVAVSVALLLVVLLAVMALAMDTSYLYLKKSSYQNGVEAAALAGVRQLCDGDWEEVTRQVAEANGVPSDSISLAVETGFYDELNEFSGNLGEYKDFGPPPSGRYINAVHVRLSHSLPSLTGMNATATVAAEAVAYLKRIDIASLDPDGAIRLGHDSVWEDTVFFANGDIHTAQTSSMLDRPFAEPVFTNSQLLAAGDVDSCPVQQLGQLDFATGKMTYKMQVLWNSGEGTSVANVHPNMDPMTEIRPVNEETLDYWRQRADIIYTPAQAGSDNVFYHGGDTNFYNNCFDLTQPLGSSRRTIYFDSGGATATLNLYCSSNHQPTGSTIAAVTFVTTGSVKIVNLARQNDSSNASIVHYGGENEDQVIIIAGGDITILPLTGSGHIYDGVVFRTGGNFYQQNSRNTELQHIRVIADRSISGGNLFGNTTYTNALNYYAKINGSDPGMYEFYNNSQFGPPCPPGMARLGLLKLSE